jgi:hypothetical protein
MLLVLSSVILGYVVSKEGNLPNSIFLYHCPYAYFKKTKDIQVFNGMAQYYQCFIKVFAIIMMAPITKLLRKTKKFEWITECQKAWEAIKQCYMDAPILISLHWDLEFHVHICL